MANVNKNQMEKFRKAWAKVIARAWSDDLFKQKLLTRPTEALKEYGMTMPAGIHLNILEETAKSEYLILPRKSSEELSDEELRAVAAGAASSGLMVIGDIMIGASPR